MTLSCSWDVSWSPSGIYVHLLVCKASQLQLVYKGAQSWLNMCLSCVADLNIFDDLQDTSYTSLWLDLSQVIAAILAILQLPIKSMIPVRYTSTMNIHVSAGCRCWNTCPTLQHWPHAQDQRAHLFCTKLCQYHHYINVQRQYQIASSKASGTPCIVYPAAKVQSGLVLQTAAMRLWLHSPTSKYWRHGQAHTPLHSQ